MPLYLPAAYEGELTRLCVSLTVTAGDDAKIRVWQVPEGGLKETLTEPELILQGAGRTSTPLF